MRTIAHLSDLHFGDIDPAILPHLRRAILDIRPDLLVVSGDLTQRARCLEFEEARCFLDSLPVTRLVVPGNHDVPFYDVFTRWLRPFARYKACISADLEPVYDDDEIAVVGLNTARALTFKNGRINKRQALACEERFARMSSLKTTIRIVVAHHPFLLPADGNPKELIGRANLGLLAFATAGVDLILSGHLHVSRTVSAEIEGAASGVLLVQAGTATSARRRGEENSFNVLRTAGAEVEIERWTWQGGRLAFAPASVERRRKSPTGWERA